MKKNLEKSLVEMFGMPIGAYAGEPMAGVRDEGGDDLDEMGVCSDCDMMVVDGSCGCDDHDMDIHDEDEPLKLSIVDPVQLDPVTIKIDLGDMMGMGEDHHDEKSCPNCGMMPVDGMDCGCGHDSHAEETCGGCGMPASMCDCEEAGTCDVCGMMSLIDDQPSCSCGMNGDGCGRMDENSCLECGMSESTCECGYMNEAKKKKANEGPSKSTAAKISKGLGKKMSTKAEKISHWSNVREPWSMAQWFKQQEK